METEFSVEIKGYMEFPKDDSCPIAEIVYKTVVKASWANAAVSRVLAEAEENLNTKFQQITHVNAMPVSER